jgi:hypothetical protein
VSARCAQARVPVVSAVPTAVPTSRLLNVGCGPFPAEGWWNVDVADGPGVDVVADAFALPWWYSDRPFDRAYLGHMLEHVPWEQAAGAVQRVAGVVVPGGLLCAVGPDVERAIRGYRTGRYEWDVVADCLEGPTSRQTHETPMARHQWNCSEDRLVRLLRDAGLDDVRAIPVDPMRLAGWPVVSHIGWQCAAIGTVTG